MLTAFYANDDSVDEDAFLTNVGAALPDGAAPAITAVPLPSLAYEGMLVEIEATAMRSAGGTRLARTTANPDSLAPLPTPFVHGVCCGEMIFVSGQSARDAAGGPPDATRSTPASDDNRPPSKASVTFLR